MRFFLFFLLILNCPEAFAWGRAGRHLVVELARGLLDEKVVQIVDYYVGTPEWDKASDLLPDQAAKTASFDQWRKVLVPKDKTYTPVKTPNLINQIEYHLMVLEKRRYFPNASVTEALKMLFCLVSDAHQPLRCGYTEDKGAVAVPVIVPVRRTYLFRLWDEELLSLRQCDMWHCTRVLVTLKERERKAIQAADVHTWIRESRELLPQVYAIEDGLATESYLNRSGDIAKMQLVKAGLRLAAILNKYFKD